MRKSEWQNPKVICPFYKRESATAITCKGLGDNQSVKRTFGLRDNLKIFRKEYCENDCERCAIYKMLLREHR